MVAADWANQKSDANHRRFSELAQNGHPVLLTSTASCRDAAAQAGEQVEEERNEGCEFDDKWVGAEATRHEIVRSYPVFDALHKKNVATHKKPAIC